MKTYLSGFKCRAMFWLLSAAMLIPLIGRAPANEAPVRPAEGAAARVGVYDSRVVAYAYFWSEASQRSRNERIAAAKAAKEKGDTELFEKLSRALKEEQQRAHLQVFSTAPIDEILIDLQAGVQRVKMEAGVSRLVSKWDEEKLRRYAAAEKIDVTAMLVRDIPLGEKQTRGMQEIGTKEPLPIERARVLEKAGKL